MERTSHRVPGPAFGRNQRLATDAPERGFFARTKGISTADDADTRGWAISPRSYLSAAIRDIRGLFQSFPKLTICAARKEGDGLKYEGIEWPAWKAAVQNRTPALRMHPRYNGLWRIGCKLVNILLKVMKLLVFTVTMDGRTVFYCRVFRGRGNCADEGRQTSGRQNSGRQNSGPVYK